jgi:hypothetical protein
MSFGIWLFPRGGRRRRAFRPSNEAAMEMEAFYMPCTIGIIKVIIVRVLFVYSIDFTDYLQCS